MPKQAVLLIVINGKSSLEMVNLFGDTHEKQINKPKKKNLIIRIIYLFRLFLAIFSNRC